MKNSVYLFALVFSSSSLANPPELQDNITQTFGGLFLVVAAILLLTWGLKKMKVTQMLTGQNKLKIVGQLVIGTKERVLVLDVNGEQVLVGVTPHQINYLKTLENPISTQESEPKKDEVRTFASLFEQRTAK